MPDRLAQTPTPAQPRCVDSHTDLAAWLAGRWTIDRLFRDRRLRIDGRFLGTGLFVPDGEGLRYDETGTLTFGDHVGPAHQTHLYRFPEPGSALVFFGDGRPFHRLEPIGSVARPRHDCGPDLYRGRVSIRSPNCWIVLWRVRGPRKHLLIASRLRRATAISPPEEGSP
ncbi:DUF6314 family protein [Inquilinus sp. CAU 1745]|uniref:DUF6314 family protein n=1 Tax=Inquilinus sp. CAU 1745 TaxID=3140369 RepID=UPI00325A7E1A